MKEIVYVPKKEVKEYKKEMHDYLQQVSKNLKEKGLYGFSVGIVGSARRNLVLRRGDSLYDVDFQLYCVKKDLEAHYREEIFDELIKVLPNGWSLTNSTSTIYATLPNMKNFDIALITTQDGKRHVSKLNKPEMNNTFVWNEVRNSNDLIEKVKMIKGNSMWKELRKRYKDLREEQWDKPKDDKKPSYALYAEAVNQTI